MEKLVIKVWNLFWILFLKYATGEESSGLINLLKSRSEITQFTHLIEKSYIPSLFRYSQATIFAPDNAAIKNYNGTIEPDMLLYHISNAATTTSMFTDHIITQISGNPRIWITKRISPDGREEIYVNDALILDSNIEGRDLPPRYKKVLHIIDRVLEPALADTSDSTLFNPDAAQFLNNSGLFRLGQHKLRKFADQATIHNKLSSFGSPGKHTFFIPVDNGMGMRKLSIDGEVIDGHIIANRNLFTRSLGDHPGYLTLAYSENLKVVANMTYEEARDDVPERIYATSNTLLGDYSHPYGVVKATVIKGNIPVSNGVVHLISKPLMIIDQTVLQLLQEEKNGELAKFNELLQNHGPDVMKMIENEKEITLFAPSNDAFSAFKTEEDQYRFNTLLSQENRLHQILRLHLVLQKVYSAGDIWTNRHQVRDVPTAALGRKLYFNIIGDQLNRTLSVEGGGVNATVTQPDIGATNGVIHIINRILGVPYQNVYIKLHSNLLVNKTYTLGNKDGFNDMLKDSKRRFTYLVPSDEAWEKAQRSMPSETKKLFMKDQFSYRVKQILEMHVITNEIYTMDQLVEKSKTGYIKMLRGDILVNETTLTGDWTGETTKLYMVNMDGVLSNVTRPDVNCTNGIIHIINTVLMKPRDITVGLSTAATFQHSITILLLLLLSTVTLCH